MIDFKTSQEVWKAIEDLYGASNRARVNQLRNILQNTKNGVIRMYDYLELKKQTSESLKLAGEPIHFNYLISCILSGLEAK